MNVVHRGQLPPSGLVYAEAVEHGREAVAVLGVVDAVGGGAEDGDLGGIQAGSQVVGNLASHGDDHSVRFLQVADIEHPLVGQLVEVEAVAHIVVSGYGLRVVVDHDSAPAALADGLQGIDAAPVELHGAADAVGP